MRTKVKQDKKLAIPKVKGMKPPREERKIKGDKPMKKRKIKGMMM